MEVDRLNEGDWCTNNDWGVDDSFYARPTWEKLQSMLLAAGIRSCSAISGSFGQYRRCFELPFIEDVPGEGVFERPAALALVVGALI